MLVQIKGEHSFYKQGSDIHARHWATNDSVQNSLSCPGGLNRPSSAPSIVAPTAYATLDAFNDQTDRMILMSAKNKVIHT